MERAGPQLKQCLELRYQTWRTSHLGLTQMFDVLGRQTACMHVWVNVCNFNLQYHNYVGVFTLSVCNTKFNHLTWRKHGQRSKNWPHPIGNLCSQWQLGKAWHDCHQHSETQICTLNVFWKTHNNQTASPQMSRNKSNFYLQIFVRHVDRYCSFVFPCLFYKQKSTCATEHQQIDIFQKRPPTTLHLYVLKWMDNDSSCLQQCAQNIDMHLLTLDQLVARTIKVSNIEPRIH